MELGPEGRRPGGSSIEHVLLTLVAVRVAVLLTGAFLTVTLLRRVLATPRSRDYLLLALGFALLTAGAFVEGVLFELFRFGLAEVHTVEAGFTAAGFAAVLLAVRYSSR